MLAASGGTGSSDSTRSRCTKSWARARYSPYRWRWGFVGGVLPYRGDVLLVVCSRRLLGLEPLTRPANVLVLRDEQEDELFGLAVDEVDGVMLLDAVQFEEKPCTLDARQKAIFAGAYKVQDGVIVRLEPELLRPSRLAELQAFADEDKSLRRNG